MALAMTLSVLILLGVGLLGFQAVWILLGHNDGDDVSKRRSGQIWTALLTVSIACLILVNLYMWSHNLLVSEPSLGLVLTQGSSHWLLRVLVFGYPFTTMLVVQSAIAARDKSHRPYVILSLGLAVAGYAAWSVQVRGSGDFQASTVYAYDLYAPYLLLWVCGCVVDWGLIVGGLERRELRRWFTTTFCLGVAAFEADQLTRLKAPLADQWRVAYWVTFILAVVSALRVALGVFAPQFFDRHPHLRRIMLSGLVLVFLGLVSAFNEELSNHAAQQWMGASCCALVLVTMAWTGKRALEKDRLFLRNEGKLVRYVLALALCVLVAFAIDLFFFQTIPQLWNLLGSTAAAIILVEIASEGTLLNVGAAAALWGKSSIVRVAMDRTLDAAIRLARVCWRAVQRVKQVPWIPRLLIQVTGAALVYVVLDELPNAHRTVIQAFGIYAPADGDKDAGRRFAELVANRVNGITLDLDENMLIAAPAALQSQSGSRNALRQAAVHTSTLEADVGSDFLDLGPIGKVPLGKILKPLQAPVRRLLGTRYIEGALIAEENGYRLIAYSSTGESWTYPHIDSRPTDLLSLARQLSFSVLSTDPDWTERGMTLDFDAFEAFLDSTWSQRSLDRLEGNVGAIAAGTSAIESLKKAVAADPGFAVAHYRLALALSTEAQYGGALEHLRAAVAARPNFGPAQDVLARLLEGGLDYDEPPLLRAIVPHNDKPKRSEQLQNLRREAKERWSRMISPNAAEWSSRDRAASHLGLCTLAVLGPSESGDQVAADGTFNCTVAAQMYRSFPEDKLDSRDRNALLAYAYNALGVLRTRHKDDRKFEDFREEQYLGCSTGALQDDGTTWSLATSGGDAHATEYFRLAYELAPHDAVVKCNFAGAQLALGNDASLKRLQTDTETQLALCNGMLDRAVDSRSAPFFRSALAACDRALDSDPFNVDALNLYAYTFRIWWYTLPELDEQEQRDGEIGKLAEQRARTAVQLAQSSAVEGKLALVESTLGEVLLTLGRPHEAMTWLNRASDDAPKHVRFSEIERDLAEALLCAHKEDAGRSRAHESLCSEAPQRADKIITAIRDREAHRESNLFAARVEPLDIELLKTRCDKAITSTQPDPATRLLKGIVSYPAQCGTKFVQVMGSGPQDASVRVWGRGLDKTGAVKDFKCVLDTAPSHGEYFAQLIDTSGHPLSERLALDTGDGSKMECKESERVIELAFVSKQL